MLCLVGRKKSEKKEKFKSEKNKKFESGENKSDRKKNIFFMLFGT